MDEDPRLAAHGDERRKQVRSLNKEQLMAKLLENSPSSREDAQQGRQRVNVLRALRDKDARQRKALAELKSLLQVYMEFDSSTVPDNPQEAAMALRARLGRLLGGRGLRGRGGQTKKRNKFFNAFAPDLAASGDGGKDDASAWEVAQLQLIQSRCAEIPQENDDLAVAS